ncbi:class I glutamine amidotransferase-like protein [Boeremia exigua]|uniref:class I glutamine amidotransferase-like protein n=1 Tax=Boeremia exigua TaxID=749465 RepID=UPI001E8D2AF1|nr:class I glutamine amidotransferase-like protein [Boeremia exigua]KAH6643821.1 class I glutamine amidotransferase-like protein [Boeremia exigua]
MRLLDVFKGLVPTIIFQLYGSVSATNSTLPRTYGIVLFRMFDVLDVHGPIEILQFLSGIYKIDIALIAETMDAVTSEPSLAAMNPFNSSVYPVLPPTHTFETAPELDVLILAGGPGWRNPTLNATLDYIARTAPNVKQVLTICTGSALAARAGIMKGRKATTNKTSWPNAVKAGLNTTWVPRARWVEDESTFPPIWSSSGVVAGIDLMLHWVGQTYSEENATFIANILEHQRIMDPSFDPFARNETEVGQNTP